METGVNVITYSKALCSIAVMTLSLSAGCNAQKPASDNAAGSAANAKAEDGKTYSEPALVGQVIDQESKKPLVGAFIYGHYATSSGTLAGGSKFGEHVRSFEVVTDAEGRFKLDAWTTGERKIQGSRNGKFPLIAVWKPGYGLEIQNLNTIAEFRSRTFASGGGQPTVVNNVVDWTAYPFELKPLKTELERYNALNNAGYPMMIMGECGWETYAALLLAQHNETKRWIKSVIPPEFIDTAGYGKGNYFHPDHRVNGYSTRTTADKLIQLHSKTQANWHCADPNVIFVRKKIRCNEYTHAHSLGDSADEPCGRV